ncbi:hypothetical protein CesoFtcFv8_000512 [Champsocephalus esox]|uniref:Uncharacterized protein n=1 Tax=Champsocephalus esox TaxID=159716 RepID=A0AAN8D724_9TELE|nr:hypothetical protein CesoFtcFv8_000512 [Champsocephalus esox]
MECGTCRQTKAHSGRLGSDVILNLKVSYLSGCKRGRSQVKYTTYLQFVQHGNEPGFIPATSSCLCQLDAAISNKMDRERSVFNMPYNDSPRHRHKCPPEDSWVEEGIEEGIEEEEEGQEFANEVQEEAEEDQECVYSADEEFGHSLDLRDEEEYEIKEMSDPDETESDMEEMLDFAAESESEHGDALDRNDEERSDIHESATFDKNSRENDGDAPFDETEDSHRSEAWETSCVLQEALDEERKARAALEEALMKEKRTTAQQEAALEHEHEEQHVLAKALKIRRVENNSLCDRIKLMDAALKQKEREHKEVIEKLQRAQHASSSRHQREVSELLVLNAASVTAMRDRLAELQEDSLKKDGRIESLHSDVLKLQSHVASKVGVVTSLEERVSKCASDLKAEQTKSSSVQRDYEAAVSQQKKDAAELARLTRGNQHLARENRRLQREEKTLQGDRGACSGLEEAMKKEEARFSRASKKIQSQEKALCELTLALEKSLTAEKLLQSSLKREKKRFEEMVAKQAGPHPVLAQQLREASAYDTLRRESADVMAQLRVLEREHDGERSDLLSLSAGREEMLSRISDGQFTITNLQRLVTELKATGSKVKAREADLEEALEREKTRNSELQRTVDQISSGLHKERRRSEKRRVELQEALKKQVSALEENHSLSSSLQKAQDAVLALQGRERSLDESNKALHRLQQEVTDLRRSHCDINAEYRELLRTHTALRVRHERLSSVRGRPDSSPCLVHSKCTC